MAKEEVKVVETKVAVDYKALAESIEKAFKADKSVDVVTDTRMENPRAMTEPEYRYIHFYNPGTEKNLFGMYIVGKNRVRFALNLKVEEFLDAGLEKRPVEKKIKGEKRKVAVDVYCEIQDAVEVAKKIIAAYQSIPVKEKTPAKEKKSEVKAEKKPSTKKKVSEKKVTTKKTTTKK